MRYVTRPRRWSMASAWSRISSKVIADLPYADEACRRRDENGQSRSGACIPHMDDKRKSEVLDAQDAEVTLFSLIEHVLGQTTTANDPHGIQEYTMSPHTRDAKQRAKARRRRYRTVQ